MNRTFNLGDLLEIVGEALPENLALVAGDTRLTYAELNNRVDRVAAALSRRDIKRGMTVGVMLYNGTEIVETLFACYKIGAIVFNINYRYEPGELKHILQDAQAAAIIVPSTCIPMLKRLSAEMPEPPRVIVLYDPGVPQEAGWESFAALQAEPIGDTDITTGRSGDDRLLIYTGGTTGTPKGVEWGHRNFFFGAAGGGALMPGTEPITTPEALAERLSGGMSGTNLSLLPLIHGAAQYGLMSALFGGFPIVIYTERSFSGEKAWALAEAESAVVMSFAGNAMGLPLLEAYDANPGRWDLKSLFVLSWGGGALTENLQAQFRARFPNAMFINGMGSTEGGSIGRGMPTLNGEGLMRMAPGDSLKVLVDGKREAAIGEFGVLARRGALPNGYWRNPEKTAETFVTVDGERYVLIGDLARPDPDGNFTFFGREATCINAGGEKIFADEVDAVMRTHPAVLDALAVGAPHPRWGETVAAIVALRENTSLTLEQLQAHCRGELAGYKLPRQMVLVPGIKRSPAGKADYRWAKAQLPH